MRFWDSSALIPLLVGERSTAAMRLLVQEDEDMAVWWATRLECRSALARRSREGGLGEEAGQGAESVVSALIEAWSEIQPTDSVRQRAEYLLTVHPLRAADALQLSAALVWAENAPRGHEFVTLDENLRAAARKEGFTVLPRAGKERAR